MTEYEKDLNELKEQILKEGNTLLTKRELLERFCEIDKEYNGRPWNLLQILSNINILVGEEPCEDAVSRKDMYFKLTNGAYPNETIEQFIDRLVKELEDMSPVTPTQRWIPVSERLPEENTSYLVTDKQGCIMIAIWCGNPEYWRNIVAWMPLPKPYKAERRG